MVSPVASTQWLPVVNTPACSNSAIIAQIAAISANMLPYDPAYYGVVEIPTAALSHGAPACVLLAPAFEVKRTASLSREDVIVDLGARCRVPEVVLVPGSEVLPDVRLTGVIASSLDCA